MATLSLNLTPMMLAPIHANDEQRWLAVLRRSPAAKNPDGTQDRFFYAVTSTGIVCRPDCPSRRPRRENTRFFNSVAEAEQSGFRACQRCRPSSLSPREHSARTLAKVVAHIEHNAALGAVKLADLAAVSGLSPFHLQRIFRAALGVSPAEYQRRMRSTRLSEALPSSSVTDAIYTAGFTSGSSAYSDRHGMTPGQRKRLGEHQHIRYSIADSPLDRMLVAATDSGICLIAFDTSDEVLREELQTRFRAAIIEQDDTTLADHVEGVLEHLRETPTARRLPLHVRATAFQQRVWKALEAIPHGETRTYAQLADSIGSPKAVRAVGTACGANPVAPVVPCHRVIGTNGALTGYRWGQERKARLLALEKHRTK